MRMLRLAAVYRIMPDPARGYTILAALLWGGVILFVFGIIADLIR
jgi:hypothetical protein